MPKVMIAEDELANADMIAEVLAANGYEVCGIARTVAQAIDLGRRHAPDLAVIDLHLAGGGIGSEIGARLRRGGRPGVLYTTGNAGEIALTADDGDACLAKPFALADLVRALRVVERIAAGAAAAPSSFPPRFEVLRPPRARPAPEGSGREAAGPMTARLLHQQAALAAFGSFAFRENDLAKILTEAARACAECLGVPFCKICRYRHEENDLLVEAGVGWRADVIGTVASRADHSSPQGRAFITGEPVICHDLSRDSAFVLPSLYADHGIVSIVDVIIKGNGRPYGVLEIDSPEPQRYGRHDVDFLTGFANVLAEAVAAAKRTRLLRSAVARMKALVAEKDRLLEENRRMLLEKNRLLEEKNLLAEELHHRVRNNLQLVYGMLDGQAAPGSGREDTGAVARRVLTLAKIHDHLLGTGLSRTIEIGGYLQSLCAGFVEIEAARGRDIGLTCDLEPLDLDLETVTVLGLVVAELVSNSCRHAFADGKGTLGIALRRSAPAGAATIVFRDDGAGYAAKSGSNRRGLGLVDRLMHQIQGRAEVRCEHGTVWTLEFPLLRDDGPSAPDSARPGSSARPAPALPSRGGDRDPGAPGSPLPDPALPVKPRAAGDRPSGPARAGPRARRGRLPARSEREPRAAPGTEALGPARGRSAPIADTPQ
jgi:two-component sensor histidine kinase/CheY-like chemotaxis protein